MSIAALQADDAFIWSKVFPRLPVVNQSGYYPVFSQADLQGDKVQRVSTGSKMARAGYSQTPAQYICEGWGLEHPIPDDVRKNQSDPVDVDRMGAKFLANQFNIRMERLFAASFMTGSNWTSNTTLSGSDQWSDYTGSSPLDAISAGRVSFITNCGRRPNIFACGLAVDQKLRSHPDVLARYKVTNADSVSEVMMARLLQVEKYLVSEAVYNTADDGTAQSNAVIVGKHAGYFYATPTPAIEEPTAGYSIVWSGGTGNDWGVAVDTYREEQTRSDIMRQFAYVQMKITAASMAYFWINAVA
jgi:hypothetical protein